MVGKRKKAKRAQAEATIAKKAARRGGTKQERRAQKLEKRKQEKKSYTAEMWAAPAPTHLVAKLDQPKVKSKHQSYFEFADNPERKQKKLEFEVGFVAISVLTATHFPSGNQQESRLLPWICIRSCRRSALDQRMQRIVPRPRCHDIYRISKLLPSVIPSQV